MRWLRRFFYSEDPTVTVVGGLTEQEAEMRRELLERNGIAAMTKNMSNLAYLGAPLPAGNEFDLFVKRSDLERAHELLATFFDSDDAQSGG